LLRMIRRWSVKNFIYIALGTYSATVCALAALALL